MKNRADEDKQHINSLQQRLQWHHGVQMDHLWQGANEDQ
jgi:hypothetical protein